MTVSAHAGKHVVRNSLASLPVTEVVVAMRKALMSLIHGSVALALVLTSLAAVADDARLLQGGRFGTLHVYEPGGTPEAVVLFASGDGGWNLGVLDMAAQLARRHAVVVGFSTPRYLHALARVGGSCLYPAGDLESLSQFVQKKLKLAHYVAPVLVGYSSGATLVYAALAAAPGGTFRGGISLGFSADLAVQRPLCRGSGLRSVKSADGKAFDLLPRPLPVPWIALQGDIDKDVSPKATNEFVRRTGNARVINLPHVGHGFSVERNWMPQYLAAFDGLLRSGDAVPATGLSAPVVDLPLVAIEPKGVRGNYFAVVLSGDGGWVNIDRSIGTDLAAHGIPVVGLNSLQYFWTRRTPAGMGADLARIIDHYGTLWKKPDFALIGYSRGADVLAFMVDSMPESLRRHIRLIALLGPGLKTSFEFHVSDWFGDASHADDRLIEPAVARLAGINLLCVYGADETDSLCPRIRAQAGVSLLRTGGGHHFGGDYPVIAKRILSQLPLQTAPTKDRDRRAPL